MTAPNENSEPAKHAFVSSVLRGKPFVKLGIAFAILAVVAILLSACGTVRSEPEPAAVAPEPPAYSQDFQDRLADELESAQPACDRKDPQPGCSAWARAVQDYGALREALRALRSEEEPENRAQEP